MAMALVDYGSSSDDSDNDEESQENNLSEKTENLNKVCETVQNGTMFLSRRNLNLPRPSNCESPKSDKNNLDELAFDKLPKPKNINMQDDIKEEDDEFLHKKAIPIESDQRKPVKGPVKITIPSLSEFNDVDTKCDSKRAISKQSTKSSGLLGLLPPPKNEFSTTYTKTEESSKTTGAVKATTTSLIPDSVKQKQQNEKIKAANAKLLAAHLKPIKVMNEVKSVTKNVESDDSDSDVDFFSLNSDQKLPEVSEKEIYALVAEKAAKIVDTASKFDEETVEHQLGATSTVNREKYSQFNNQTELDFDKEAMQALVGSRAKRQKIENINVVDLSSDQVLPDKDEWLRSALASTTGYQAKGVLADEEPMPGTRKKHQITYLAHQAKVNEQELQAMWAANRHTRRQTQSKYGF